jgi:hypothetical protein
MRNQHSAAVVAAETAEVVAALTASAGNICQAARALGMSRRGLHHKIARLGLCAEDYRPSGWQVAIARTASRARWSRAYPASHAAAQTQPIP